MDDSRNTSKHIGDLPGDLTGAVTYPVFRETGRWQVSLRESAIQRGSRPNKRRRREPVAGCGGMLPREILKLICLRSHFMCFEGGMI